MDYVAERKGDRWMLHLFDGLRFSSVVARLMLISSLWRQRMKRLNDSEQEEEFL